VILLVAVISGLIAGYTRAFVAKRSFKPATLKFIVLVFIALLAQWLIFTFDFSRSKIPDNLASIIFVFSQFVLLFFAWSNRSISGFWLLGLGLMLNLTVIIANGGWMPISPPTVEWLAQKAQVATWQIGSRLGLGKDIVLTVETTKLWILSDQLHSPDWLPYRFAFSIGDIMIAAGAFWVFWSIGGGAKHLRIKE
jgi:hypothetical protein